MEEKEIIRKIEEKKKLPEEVKNKIMSEIFECVLSSIIVYVYFIFLRLGAKNIHESIYITDLKVFATSLAVLAVWLLEKSYTTKNRKKLYRSIEILILATITLLIQYTVIYLIPKYRIIIPMFAIIYNIYFVLKSLAMIYKTKTQYRNSLSDIKEIVTKEK